MAQKRYFPKSWECKKIVPMYPIVRGSTLRVQGDKLVKSPAASVTPRLENQKRNEEI